tara:strand:+ start:178 stop:1305 length:1128 start_codon:yes stop_codon:yes gene_type:complete
VELQAVEVVTVEPEQTPSAAAASSPTAKRPSTQLDFAGMACAISSVQSMLSSRLDDLRRVSSDTSATPAMLAEMTEDDWFEESIRVFQGEITNPWDKTTLVLPILGLYAEVYACATGEVSAEEEAMVSHSRTVLRLIKENQDEILPRCIRVDAKKEDREAADAGHVGKLLNPVRRASRLAQGMRGNAASKPQTLDVHAMSRMSVASPTLKRMATSKVLRSQRLAQSKATAEASTSRKEEQPGSKDEPMSASTRISRALFAAAEASEQPTVEVELFGNLVETVEAMIDEDDDLRDSLLSSALQRRASMAKKSNTLKRHNTTGSRRESARCGAACARRRACRPAPGPSSQALGSLLVATCHASPHPSPHTTAQLLQS